MSLAHRETAYTRPAKMHHTCSGYVLMAINDR